jgi:single-strand DNA-binding protein
MNNFSGIGRVGGDPVVTQTKEGKAVATFSVVVDSGYGDKKIGTWIKVALFEKRATVAEYISKGDKIGINGEIVNREWTAKDGTKQHTLELANANVTLLASKKDAPQASPKAQQTIADNFDPFSDNVPF